MSVPSIRDRRIAPEEAHEILRNSRRRHALQYLKRRIEPVTLRELAEGVAERESGQTPPPRDLRQSVYNSLHQTHLPKMNDVDLVEYDSDRKTVVLSDEAREIDDYMCVLTRYGVTWSGYYRTLGVLALVLVVLAETGVPGFAHVGVTFFTTAFLAIFTASTAYQLWTRRWFYLRSLLGR